MASLAERFTCLAGTRSPFCLGLDPSADLLGLWGLSDDAQGLRRFCGAVLDAAGDLMPMMKLQMAFFERHGPAGLTVAAEVAAQIRAGGGLCMIDAKRGDIASTMEGYADAIFGSGGGLCADAVTVSPYLGFEALEPIIRRAHEVGGGVFVVIRSSNPDGWPQQSARLGDGRSVAEGLADEISAQNAAFGADVGPIGAVVGATLAAGDAAIVERLERSLILAPGLGAQGAQMADVGRRFGSARGRIVPTASRGILRQGPDRTRLRDAMRRYRDAAWAIWETDPVGETG